MKADHSSATWIKFGFFLLGFSLMCAGLIFALGHFIIPRYIDPVVDKADPRGLDAILVFSLLPFLFLFSVLSGMLSVNLSLWLSKSKRKALLPYFAVLGYFITTYGIVSFIYRLRAS